MTVPNTKFITVIKSVFKLVATKTQTWTHHRSYFLTRTMVLIEAKRLLGQWIPANTVRASQSPINKLSIFITEQFCKQSKTYSTGDIKHLKDHHARNKCRSDVLNRAIFDMRLQMFGECSGGVLPNVYSTWTEAQLKNINKILMEFFLMRRSQEILRAQRHFLPISVDFDEASRSFTSTII